MGESKTAKELLSRESNPSLSRRRWRSAIATFLLLLVTLYTYTHSPAVLRFSPTEIDADCFYALVMRLPGRTSTLAPVLPRLEFEDAPQGKSKWRNKKWRTAQSHVASLWFAMFVEGAISVSPPLSYTDPPLQAGTTVPLAPFFLSSRRRTG